eukprot:EC724256.1.p1 GENE.EC724256.1~~EC724256.1.p1  ORF type:complete len:174 (+),score=29.06 EC724256.1:95-616(+)
MSVSTFPLFPGRTLTTYLYRNVSNAKEIREKVLSGHLPAAALDPTLLVDIFQIEVAAMKVLLQEQAGRKRVTNTIHTELIFVLSGSTNISKALTTFGLKENSTDVCICVFDATPEQTQTIRSLIAGEERPARDLSQSFEEKAVLKAYGIVATELNTSPLLQSVVTRIACRDSL